MQEPANHWGLVGGLLGGSQVSLCTVSLILPFLVCRLA